MAFSRKQEIAVIAVLACLQVGSVGYAGYVGYQIATRCDLQTKTCEVSYTSKMTRLYMLAYLNTAPQAVNIYHGLARLAGLEEKRPAPPLTADENEEKVREWLI